MRIPIVMLACRRDGDWRDVELAIASIRAYAPDCPLFVAWSGPRPPRGVLGAEQPKWIDNYGDALRFALDWCKDDQLILANDDIVLCPDSVDLLLEDVARIGAAIGPEKVGFVGARSNYVAGHQNVRVPAPNCTRFAGIRWASEADVIAAPRISPIFAYVQRAALDEIGGPPPLHWYSDDLMCFDMAQKGRQHFVSRSYVHHVGERATRDAGLSQVDCTERAFGWLRQHRPDFCKAWGIPA